ncbi:MAG TPA: hypothetical protein ENI53_03045, partial [Thermoplasmatales archaeon]|nr:hypothetical protein [Thermoplasmatales archaeon]
MKEKIGICVAIIFILTAVGTVSGEDLSIIDISPQEKTVSVGSTFTLNINITPAEPISAAACNVTFDPAILQALDVSNGGMFDGWWDDVVPGGLIEINNTAGKISYIAATSSYNVTEEGTFAIITFQAISTGISYVNIEDATIHGKSPPDIIVINGSVTVIEGDTTPPVITLEDYPASVINYRDVHFEWNATDDVTAYQNILFSYKLEGHDSSWSSWGYIKQKDYYNLDAGSYTFRIKAKD